VLFIFRCDNTAVFWSLGRDFSGSRSDLFAGLADMESLLLLGRCILSVNVGLLRWKGGSLQRCCGNEEGGGGGSGHDYQNDKTEVATTVQPYSDCRRKVRFEAVVVLSQEIGFNKPYTDLIIFDDRPLSSGPVNLYPASSIWACAIPFLGPSLFQSSMPAMKLEHVLFGLEFPQHFLKSMFPSLSSVCIGL
jgi:hypothetical protein